MDIQNILSNHLKWLKDRTTGARANLRGADLSGANLSGVNLVVLITAPWTAYIQPETIRIGCQYHTTQQWKEFDDNAISRMSDGALKYWKKNKNIIITIAESLK